jgi:peptidoglycan hydrolase-like protein with peptidoglycan-binding domain
METLRQGSTGQLVQTVQRLLNSFGYYLPITGIFDEMTYFAVIDFQRENFLTTDGIIGPKTWAALGFTEGSSKSTVPSSVGVTPTANVPVLEQAGTQVITQAVTPTGKISNMMGYGLLLIAAGAIIYYIMPK